MEAHIWNTFSDKRFKKLLRVLGDTFLFIVGHIRHDLLRDSVCEEPILLNVVLLSAYIV